MEPLTGLISSHLGQGKVQEAKTYLNKIINEKPKNAFAVNLLGNVYLFEKNESDAEKTFKKAIKVDPKWFTPYRNLARLYIRQETPEKALDVYLQGLEVTPEQPVLALELAMLYQSTGAINKAIEVYEILYEKQPNNNVAANNLAALIADHQQDKESLKRAFEIAKRFQNSNEPAYLDTYGWLDHLSNQSSQAILTLEAVVKKAPNFPQFHYHLGMAYLANDRTVEAKAAFEKALPSEETDYPGAEKAREALKGLESG